MSALVLYHFDLDAPVMAGLPGIAVPVRKEKAWEVFQGSTVHLGRLLLEVDAVVGEDDGLASDYRTFLVRLARLVGSEAAVDGDFERALAATGVGLRHDPTNVTLHLQQALALQGLGRDADAWAVYRRVLWNPDFDGGAIAIVLAARAALAAGDGAGALQALRALPAQAIEDPGIGSLIEACGGVLPSSGCASCGFELGEGFEFCPKCGTPVG